MKYLKELAIIFGITMVGEILNELIPLPVPAGVYGLFLLLGLLCAKIVKMEDVAATGNLLLDIMPLMFVPAAVGLIEKYMELTAILLPFIVISAVSTLIVMTVTGKTTEMINIAKVCAKMGIPIAVITNQANSELSSYASYLLLSSTKEIEYNGCEASSIVSQTFILDILVQEIFKNIKK